MARALRVQYPGAIYHVTGRMVGGWRDERLRLFRDSKDYQRFLDRLAESGAATAITAQIPPATVFIFLPLIECPSRMRSRTKS